MIRCAIVEDELLAREGLELLLAAEPDLQIVFSAETYEAAHAQLLAQPVDLLLLDVRLGPRSGFDLLEVLGQDRPPAVVIVTSHDLYAHPAFDAAVLDFVLKPVDRARFAQAIERARQRLASSPMRIALLAGGLRTFVESNEIDWISAEGNYVNVHVGAEVYLHRATLAQMEAELQSHGFQRVHRSTLVQIAAIRQVTPSGNGEAELLLRTGARVHVSRSHRDALLDRVED